MLFSETEAYTVDIGYWNKSGIFIHLPLLPFNNSSQPDSVCSVDCGKGFRKIMEVTIVTSNYIVTMVTMLSNHGYNSNDNTVAIVTPTGQCL